MTLVILINMFLLSCILSTALSLSCNEIQVLYGPMTSKLLINELSEFPHKTLINFQNYAEIINSLQILKILLIIDVSFEPCLYPVLDKISMQSKTIYLSLSPPSTQSFSPWRINLHNYYHEESAAIEKLIIYLK